MLPGDKRFVRIDQRKNADKIPVELFDAHVEYLRSIDAKHHLIAGGFSNKDGGLIIIEANTYEEAKKILENDPIIVEEYYTFELIEWDIVLA